MGWYFRKSFSAGPFRLNLSRSGLGASFGVRGARIGTGPRGNYIRLGVGGLYYQQSLGPGARSSPSRQPVAPQLTLNAVGTEDAALLVDASSATILGELERVRRRFQLLWLVVIAVIVSLVIAAGGAAPWWVFLLIFIFAVPGMLYVRHLDVTNGTAILRYDLDPQIRRAFEALTTAFSQFGGCCTIWHIHAMGQVNDWKRNAGASSHVARSIARRGLSLPPRVSCNIQIPMLEAGRSTLFFFPDRILVYQQKGIGSVSYGNLNTAASQTRFIEEGSVPFDAKVVDHRWRYVNKNGGPDRRFNNNRQLPICLYDEIHLHSDLGLNEIFQASKSDACRDLAAAIARYAAAMRQHPVQGFGPVGVP